MKKVPVFVLGLVVIASPALAQNPATPVYEGYQTDLVAGTQDGPATSEPKIRHAYLVAPDTLALTVDAEAMPLHPLEDYVAQPGDEIREENVVEIGPEKVPYASKITLVRNGVTVGRIFGPKRDKLRREATLQGQPLDLAWAESPASYALSSTDDPAFTEPLSPIAIHRKSKPELPVVPSQSKPRHELYLKFAHPLTPGKKYRLAFKGDATPFIAPVTFTFDDTRLRTEAIAVNQVGYHPDQPEKIAFLSLWLGSAGGVDYSAFKKFHVIDAATGKPVFTGDIVRRAPAVPGQKQATERKDGVSADLPMDVYALDFSAFKTPGNYRVSVPGLGASFPFRIDNTVWDHAATVSARGFFHQRAGIALGPPHTTYVRPMNLHPTQGFPTPRVDEKIYFDPKRFPPGRSGGNSWGNPFERIRQSILPDTNVTEAWGGWMDAGDYDRSILPQQHTRAVHVMLDLYESNPAFFEKLKLNIPESGNRIPDILDEALWCMELFRRTQQPDGGVPSNVESIEHPDGPSYLLTQPTAVNPPTPQTCHLYAAAAAQLSLALAKYDPALAAKYKQSALRAMAWADKNPEVPNIHQRPDICPADEHANLADAWMFRLTGDKAWHERFKRSLARLYPDGKPRLDSPDYNGPWGLVAYALAPANQADPALQEKCRAAVLAVADRKVVAITAQPFHLGPSLNWDERIGQPWEVIAAHRLTGDPKYTLALQRTGQFALGANPTNQSYTTGLGSRTTIPFLLDPNYLGVNWPEGITTGGPLPLNFWDSKRIAPQINESMFPTWENWPWAESTFNVRAGVTTEHTIAGSLANVLLLRGYVAQDLAKKNP